MKSIRFELRELGGGLDRLIERASLGETAGERALAILSSASRIVVDVLDQAVLAYVRGDDVARRRAIILAAELDADISKLADLACAAEDSVIVKLRSQASWVSKTVAGMQPISPADATPLTGNGRKHILTMCILNAVVCMLPPIHRKRYHEEFWAELGDLPGWFARLQFALRVLARSLSLRRCLRRETLAAASVGSKRAS